MILTINIMPCGKLTIITGPMFSGKTTELLRLYERKVIADVPCLLVKYKGDGRYSETHVISHNKLQSPARVVAKLNELFTEDITKYDTIFIDEIQFFPDKERIDHLLAHNIDVVVSGLNGDWNRHMFPGMADLFARAYNIIMLQAICGFCKSEEACYNKKVCQDTGDIIIGGSDKFIACCLNCYLDH